MRYLLIEFLGVFTMVFYKGLSNISYEEEGAISFANLLIQGLILIIFVNISFGLSAGFFNPCFAIVKNLWGEMGIDTALGYIATHMIACLFAAAVLSLIVPFENILESSGYALGTKILDSEFDFFSILTAEVVGSAIAIFGFTHYFRYKDSENREMNAMYYGLITIALSLATFDLTGGAYNLSMIFGSILFNSTMDIKVVALFGGNLIGCIIGKVMHDLVLSEKSESEDSKALKKLLKR